MNKILVTTTAAIAIFIFVQTGFAAKISVVPANQTVLKDENFTVNISINPEGSEVAGAQYELYFNNTLLKALDQERGPFLRQDGNDSNVYKNEFDNTIGKFKYSEARIDTDGGVTNPEVLATITFQAIAEENGVSELNFTVVKLSDPYTNPIPTEVSNGTCEIEAVEQTPTPTPSPTPAPTHTSTSGSGGSGNGGASGTPTPTSSPAPTQTPGLTPEPTVTPAKTPVTTSTQIPTVVSSPSLSAVVTTSPTPVSMPTSEEERKLPGFEAMLSIIALFGTYLISKARKGGDRNE
jgi:hypothetical protein